MASEDENTGFVLYCRASCHVTCCIEVADRFVLQEGEPFKLFEEDPDDSITWLYLWYFKGAVDDSTFTLLPGLESLYIKNSEFEKWSPEVFSPLKSLESLTIRTSKLPLHSGTFESANTLKCLSLDDVEDIGPNIFISLQNLEKLTLEKCNLGNVSKETFSGLEKVTYLRISECEISDLSEDAFEPLKNLDTLILSENKIGNLNWDAFLTLNNLTDLSFCDNSTANYDIFKKLPKLETIYFETEVYKDLDFDGFPALKKVNFPMYESNDLVKMITEKLEAKNIEWDLVLTFLM